MTPIEVCGYVITIVETADLALGFTKGLMVAAGTAKEYALACSLFCRVVCLTARVSLAIMTATRIACA